MQTEIDQLNDIHIKKTVQALEKNNFQVKVFEKKTDVIEYLKELVPNQASIGYGGSRTLEEINFFEVFNPQSYPNMFNRRDPDLSQEEKRKLQISSLSADYFFCSVNGLSMSGEMVMIDMWGNRNGAITYGPGKKVIITGQNKISPDLPKALERAANHASVINNLRFNTGNPCTKAGQCVDCNSQQRLCSVTTIVHRCQPPQSILVILIKENLGF